MSILGTSALRRAWAPACGPASSRVRIDLYGAGSITVRRECEAAFRALNDCLRVHNYRTRKQDTGAYNCRRITGGTGYSLHAYGIAADLNWSTNPYGPRLVTDMPKAMRDAIKAIRTGNGKQVFGWGGDYRTNKDAMHYEIVCTPADLATGIVSHATTTPAPKPDPNVGRTWVTFAGAGTTDAGVYAAGGLDNEVSAVQLLIGHPVTKTYTAADAKAVAALKVLAHWVDPDDRDHDRGSGVTPAFHQALEGLAGKH